MKNKNSKLNFALLILMFTFAGPLLAQAADYYVSPTGAASWANCQSATPLSGTTACSLSTANTNAAAGDTVYLRAGSYATGIAPSKSGTAAARITYQNYGGEVVTLTASTAISLNGKNYVTVTGINGGPCKHCLIIKNGNYNIVAYGNFGPYSTPGDGQWELNVIDTDSQYNWIHHNNFHDFGACVGTPPSGRDDASVLDIGRESQADTTKYNLLEDNIFSRGGHHVVAIHTGYNTFRNNYVHNEAWASGAGNRNLYLNNMVGTSPDVGHNVIEGNKFGYAAKPCDAITVGSVSISTNYNIFRYNGIAHANANGLGTSAYGNANSLGSYNHFYSNTIFNTGLGNLLSPTLSADTYTSEHDAINFFNSANKGNVLRNNLFYKTVKAYGGSTSAQDIANDWDGNTKGNPLFISASTTPGNPNDITTFPNFNLQPTSPAIDKGGALTTVAAGDTGSGTTLMVADSLFFQDGSYAPPGTVQADWIAVGTVMNIVQIASINQATNTITLANSISRMSGDSVWLYKKSDGVRVLYGSTPDAGAFEYTGSTSSARPSAPTNLQVAP